MGPDENYAPGGDFHKVQSYRSLMMLTNSQTPRGILNWAFSDTNDTQVAWKVTGNLGGEHVRQGFFPPYPIMTENIIVYRSHKRSSQRRWAVTRALRFPPSWC